MILRVSFFLGGGRKVPNKVLSVFLLGEKTDQSEFCRFYSSSFVTTKPAKWGPPRHHLFRGEIYHPLTKKNVFWASYKRLCITPFITIDSRNTFAPFQFREHLHSQIPHKKSTFFLLKKKHVSRTVLLQILWGVPEIGL